jgi:hypothetical protein
MKTGIRFWSYLAHFFSEWEIFQAEVVDNLKTHILCSISFFSKIVPFMRWRGKNIVQPDRPQMTTYSMSITCWITKATNTHSEYVILTAFPLQQWLQEGASILRCTYISVSCGHVIKMWKEVAIFPSSVHFQIWI